MTAPAVELGPPEPAPDAGPLELCDHAERLLELHDEQDRPEEAGASWQRCRDTLLRARDLLESTASAATPAALSRARYLLGLTLSVGYWQALSGKAAAYGVEDVHAIRDTAATLLSLSRATLPTDTPAYATACVRLGLLLHGRYEEALEQHEALAAGAEEPGAGPGAGARGRAGAGPAADVGADPGAGAGPGADAGAGPAADAAAGAGADAGPAAGAGADRGAGADARGRAGAGLAAEDGADPGAGAGPGADAGAGPAGDAAAGAGAGAGPAAGAGADRGAGAGARGGAAAGTDTAPSPWQDDLDDALDAFGDGLPRLEDEPHPGLFVTYGCALADRYEREPGEDGLRQAVGVLEAVLDGVRPAGWEPAEEGAGSWVDEADELETEARVRLIRVLLASPDGGDHDMACGHLELLAATLPDEHHARIFTAGHLVDVYRERGDGRVGPDDRAAYLLRLRDLCRLLDPGNVFYARAQALLGAALAERVESTPAGSPPTAENEEAVGLLRGALDGLAQDDDLRASSHAVLGCLINSLRDFLPKRYDNDEALRHLERAVEMWPADDPLRGELLRQLAHAGIVRNDEEPADLAGVDRTIALLNESARLPAGVSEAGTAAHGAYAAALSQRHALSNSADDLEASIRHLTAAFRQAAADDANRLVFLHNLAVNLYQRYQTGGDHQDLVTAARYLQEVGAVAAGATAVQIDVRVLQGDRLYVERALVQMQFMLALTAGSKPGMSAAVERMRGLRETVPEDDPERIALDADFGQLLIVRSFYGGTPKDRFDGLRLAMESAQALPEGHSDRPVLLLRAAGAMMATGFVPYNRRAVDAAEKLLREALDAVAPDSQVGLRVHGALAMLCYLRFLQRRAPADADSAVELAAGVRERLADSPPSPLSAQIAEVLAESLRARSGPGDGEAARRAGIAGLRDTATVVLLQVAAEPALQVAGSAAERALKIARWCLADDDLPGAVEALELGRGLVLHASTTTADVPALLREAGHPDLAEEWEGGTRPPPMPGPGSLLDGPGTLLGGLGEGAELPLPDDLRQRTLAALAKSRAGTALMSPLTPDAIAAALRTAGAHALVYLLPPGGGRPGTAVVISREAAVDTVDFGLLRHNSLTPLTAYRDAHRDHQRALDQAASAPGEDATAVDAAYARWRRTLGELCDWAGPVVMAPLARTELLRSAGSEPHLVMVPFGELSGIPWHAALLSSGLRHGGRPVRAVERMTLSYAASARQLHEVLGRPRLGPGAGAVIVGNPDGSLPGAGTEARHIHAALYSPGGRLLGSVRRAVGRGVPDEVLAALPGRGGGGAGVLHLACHARPSGNSPLDACLLLAPPEGEDGSGRLLVRDILGQARGRPPGAPGGLVVLDACVSDHASGDFDEALTLSTAFLAAGATAVVGSRWEVPDGLTGLMMYVFHDRLRAGSTPVRALREAQLWLLDPERRLPAGMPRAVADILNDGDPAAVELWAAFSCQGH